MSKSKALRGAKTIFFLLAMTASLLVCAPPLSVGILDVIFPSVLFSASSGRAFTLPVISSQLKSYDFHTSLVDVPLVSIARSILVLCAYGFWAGRGPYLAITMVSNFASIAYVLIKALAVCGAASASLDPGEVIGRNEVRLTGALFLFSLAMAMAHVVVAYKTSSRERRKLVVYKIDLEAAQVSSYSKVDFPNYQKIALHR